MENNNSANNPVNSGNDIRNTKVTKLVVTFLLVFVFISVAVQIRNYVRGRNSHMREEQADRVYQKELQKALARVKAHPATPPP